MPSLGLHSKGDNRFKLTGIFKELHKFFNTSETFQFKWQSRSTNTALFTAHYLNG